jgi:hypothetical protein
MSIAASGVIVCAQVLIFRRNAVENWPNSRPGREMKTPHHSQAAERFARDPSLDTTPARDALACMPEGLAEISSPLDMLCAGVVAGFAAGCLRDAGTSVVVGRTCQKRGASRSRAPRRR